MRVRRRAAGLHFLAMSDSVKMWLQGEVTMTRLSAFVKTVATSKSQRIDRLSKRTKEGLICWLCENAPEIALGWSVPPGPMVGMRPPTPPSAPPAVIWPTLLVEEPTVEPVRADVDADPRTQFPRLAEELAN
jgi:hypothetical protein